ncbi:MAG TPA: diguanylate cyclase [Tepidisphaeraceae bacterium]|jgi:diguanylate cyclase (GGDEF)-like protein
MPQKVLIIDDSKPIHALLKARLADEPIELHSAFDGEAGVEAALNLLPDLILLDVDMPTPDGFEVCRRLKDHPLTMNVPVVFLTGIASTEQKIRGLELGALDYIIKPFDPAELRARVRTSLRQKYLLELLAKKAMIDGLTGLWNRSYFDQQLAAQLALFRRSGYTVSCIFADVDHFKTINDNFGHPTGDEALRAIAHVLQSSCRLEDIVCRYGGEEFAIVCPNTPADKAIILAERLRESISRLTMSYRRTPIPLTASFGIADPTTAGSHTLIEAADQALYRAKQLGRNRVVIASQEAEPVALKVAS